MRTYYISTYYLLIPINDEASAKYYFVENPFIINTQNYIYKMLINNKILDLPFTYPLNITLDMTTLQQSNMKTLIKSQDKTIALLNINSNLLDIQFIAQNILKNNFSTHQENKD